MKEYSKEHKSKHGMHHSSHSKRATGSMESSGNPEGDNSSYSVGEGGSLSHYLKDRGRSKGY